MTSCLPATSHEIVSRLGLGPQPESLTYEAYVNEYTEVISELREIHFSPKIRIAAAERLDTLSRDRIETIEKNYNFLERILHMIGQYFSGHGFQTQGEWSLGQAQSMLQYNKTAFELQIQEIMEHSPYICPTETNPTEMLEALGKDLTWLPDEQFKRLLDHVIFQPSTVQIMGKSRRLIFFEKLSPAKQLIFMQELLKRDDWYKHALTILQGAQKQDVDRFITPEMVNRYLDSAHEIQLERHSMVEGDIIAYFVDSIHMRAQMEYPKQFSALERSWSKFY
ncbi:MAG: hypothetical protein S4CHLAM102_01160 [Chlamydiia bacterium]|nr:hypothetical protein [Chlamydiia bacterium]